MNTFVDVAHSHAEVAIVFCLFQKSPFVLVQALYYALILYTEEVFIRRILNAFVIGDFNQIIRFIVRVLVFSVLLICGPTWVERQQLFNCPIFA